MSETGGVCASTDTPRAVTAGWACRREKTKRSEKRMGWERRRVRLCEDFIIRPQRNEKSLESSEQQPLTVPLRLHQG